MLWYKNSKFHNARESPFAPFRVWRQHKIKNGKISAAKLSRLHFLIRFPVQVKYTTHSHALAHSAVICQIAIFVCLHCPLCGMFVLVFLCFDFITITCNCWIMSNLLKVKALWSRRDQLGAHTLFSSDCSESLVSRMHYPLIMFEITVIICVLCS